MTLKELKSGMVVEIRDGRLYLVVGDFITRDNGFFVLEEFQNNLKSKSSFKGFDIVKVYERYNDVYENYASSLETLFDKEHLKLLWERKEKITLTDREKEILKALDTLGFNWLTRDEDGHLFSHEDKPEKLINTWWSNYSYANPRKKDREQFNFIKWEDKEPTKIDDLLKGEIK